MSDASAAAAGTSAMCSPNANELLEPPLHQSIALDEFAEIEDSLKEIRRKPSAEGFSRILSGLGLQRRASSANLSLCRRMTSMQSISSHIDDGGNNASGASPDEADCSVVEVPAEAGAMCCCQKTECEASKCFAEKVSEMESDLQLSAEIGQALLRRQETMINRAQQESEEHAAQRDKLLERFTQSIKENKNLSRQLTQANMNLEAADQSHHALLTELEEMRKQMRDTKMHRAKSTGMSAKLTVVNNELEDARQELLLERQRFAALEKSAKHAMDERVCTLQQELEEEREKLRRMRACAVAESKQQSAAWHSQRAKLDAHGTSNGAQGNDLPCVDKVQAEACDVRPLAQDTDERILQQCSARSVSGSSASEQGSGHPSTAHTTPTSLYQEHFEEKDAGRPSFGDTCSVRTVDLDRSFDSGTMETRTVLLDALLDAVQRAFYKLAHADIDTMTARLHRQKLAGDVGHLARTSVQSAVRDMEGLREHLKRQMERDLRHTRNGVERNLHDTSLVTRRDFFQLFKLLKEIMLELAKLRRCVNDIQLDPANAAKVLHEHLGVNTTAPKGSWIARMLTGAISSAAEASGVAHAAPMKPGPVPRRAPELVPPMVGAAPTSTLQSHTVPMRHTGALPAHLTPRASTLVMPSSVAVQFAGSHASPAGAHFSAASFGRASVCRGHGTSQLRAMDTEGALGHWNKPTAFDSARVLRPRARGLSDSSMHSTLLEHAPVP